MARLSVCNKLEVFSKPAPGGRAIRPRPLSFCSFPHGSFNLPFFPLPVMDLELNRQSEGSLHGISKSSVGPAPNYFHWLHLNKLGHQIVCYHLPSSKQDIPEMFLEVPHRVCNIHNKDNYIYGSYSTLLFVPVVNSITWSKHRFRCTACFFHSEGIRCWIIQQNIPVGSDLP